jgi:hypothetical protein
VHVCVRHQVLTFSEWRQPQWREKYRPHVMAHVAKKMDENGWCVCVCVCVCVCIVPALWHLACRSTCVTSYSSTALAPHNTHTHPDTPIHTPTNPPTHPPTHPPTAGTTRAS